MNTYEPRQEPGQEQESIHDTVGAYVLGILDDAEATAFEAHLAGCDICAAHLEEFSGIEPMLAMLAEAPAPPQREPDASGLPGVPEQSAGPAASGMGMGPLPGMRDMSSVPGLPEYRQRAGGRRSGNRSSGNRSGGRSAARRPAVPHEPSPRMLDGLLGEVAVKRDRRRKRGLYLVAAAAALVIGGPTVAVVVTAGDAGAGSRSAAGEPTGKTAFEGMDEQVRATDPTTKVSAVVGMQDKAWGTRAVLELKNVKGPLRCSLVAVSKTGEEEVVTSWAVPEWGYGIPGSTHKSAKDPLYVQGGSAMERNDIDHFEVRTFDGERLVEVDA
ncbi:anti-sigma factor family protein [Streptomyces sp. MUM 178J]|uniref:anti-sigma factor family protein n=1 Tax=Streptomyces sp. MUM 178J TaxID=2791991 RepID=UPI001F04BF17|nr:zf-HC2 domain-containing protein [Streptomyces sp. MUM 178J]WRQ79650.1 zf-HC2 domain-containing protein [Streptomyces sp. MUM 178J]